MVAFFEIKQLVDRHHRVFGGAIGDPGAPRVSLASHRRGGDDETVAARAHRRQNRRRAIVDALDIDIDDLVPSIEGAARPVAVGGVDAVIVEQHVDRTEMFVDADHCRADRGTIDHIDR